MTRLTEALDRARTAVPEAEPSAESNTAPGVVNDVPGTWRFEEPAHVRADAIPPTVAAAPPAVEIATIAGDVEERESPVPPAPFREQQYTFAQEAAPKLVVGTAPDHTLVEQYRHLAASLHHAQLRRGVRTVMVTSAVESEGKTTTAANLALTLSHSHQRRVLLIDADLRRPSVHTLFQLKNVQGLGDALRDGEGDKSPLIHRISPTLSILTAGRPTSDPMSALVSEDMRELIEDAREHFDWVVVDTPPVALLSDANLLAAMIDVAILVVAATSTAYPLVRRAQEAIGTDRILGVVLNRARRSDLALGYGYYYYGYNYNPKNADEPKKGLLSRLFGRRG